MTILKVGQRAPLASILSSSRFSVEFDFKAPSGMVVDFVCFGLDQAGKLSDDRYMTFFNQPETPCGSVRQISEARFALDLDRLPMSIHRLTFTASVDGNGQMSSLRDSEFRFMDSGEEKAACPFSGMLFSQERALMVLDLYRKDGSWRCNSVLQGFNEGLDAIVRHFGGEVADTEQAPKPSTITLEKKGGG